MRTSFTVRRILFAISCGALLTIGSAQAGQVLVTNTNNALAGSLRQAILDANAGDVIVFQIPTSDPGYDSLTHAYTISLTTAELIVSSNLTLDGGGQKITVRRTNAAPKFRIFHVMGGNVTISGLTIANGNTGFPGADSLWGGGIRNAGSNLVVNNCTFTSNDGALTGGAIYNVAGTLVVNGCTFYANTANYGGGLRTSVPATVNNSTFFANSSVSPGGDGGGIYNDGLLTVTNCTMVGNSAAARGGGIFSDAAGTAHVRNTIIAGNNSTGAQLSYDVAGAFVSDGYNFIGIFNNLATGFGGSGSHDQTGTNASPLNPGLGLLEDNSGPTLTFAPASPSSPVVDRGNRGTDSNGQPINTDQRGSPRPVDLPGSVNGAGSDGSDVGAVESGLPQSGPTFTVTNTADRATGACTADNCTLLDALTLSNAAQDENVINFVSGLTGTITNGSGESIGFVVGRPLTLNGPGARVLTLSGSNGKRVLFVASSNAVISGLTIALGGSPTPMSGGGIYSTGGGSLTLRDCVISECSADNEIGGGGIYNDSGTTLVLTRCTLSNNQTNLAGGAVYNLGTVTVTNCTFFQNESLNGGAIISKANNGLSSTTLRNCTITTNFADDANQGGGGVYAEGSNAQFHLGNTIISGNFSGGVNPDIRGNVTSDGFNFIGKVGSAGGLTNGVNGDQIGSGAGINPNLSALLRDNGGPTNTVALLSPSSAINAGNDALAPATDQRGYLRTGVSDIGAYEFGGTPPTPTPTPTPTATPPSTTLANISTRMRVETGDNVLIGGFIVTGTQPKKVIVRAIGPSLPVPGKLADPTLELHGPAGLITSNDNWQDAPNRQEIIDSTVPPTNNLESAILTTLPANSTGYTAIVRGASGGTGVGLVEVYDLDRTVDSKLANISSRGFVQTDDNVMIGGFIIVGTSSQRVIVRAIGPSLPVPGALADPTLELYDSNGVIIASNDNWRSDQEAEIIASTVPPTNDLESAIVATLPPAAHTAIVRGKNGTTGVALVEVFGLQ